MKLKLLKKNLVVKVENVVLQKLSSELDVSIIFHCDKSDLEIDKEDALDTHKEYYNINPCQMCSINFDNEDRLKFITKIPTRTENSP